MEVGPSHRRRREREGFQEESVRVVGARSAREEVDGSRSKSRRLGRRKAARERRGDEKEARGWTGAQRQGKRVEISVMESKVVEGEPPPGGRESRRKAEGFREARRGQREGIRRGIEKGGERSDQVADGRAADIRETRSVRQEERTAPRGGAPAPTLLLNAFHRPGSNFFDRRQQPTHQFAAPLRPTQSPRLRLSPDRSTPLSRLGARVAAGRLATCAPAGPRRRGSSPGAGLPRCSRCTDRSGSLCITSRGRGQCRQGR